MSERSNGFQRRRSRGFAIGLGVWGAACCAPTYFVLWRFELDRGFGDEEAAEAVVHELDADYAFAGFVVADVDDAALGGEVVFFVFATGAGLRERDGDVEVHADGYVEARFEGGAAAAEIFA